MARKVMRTIRDRREELSNELTRVRPLLGEGFSRRPGIDTSSLDRDDSVALSRKHNAMIKDCAEQRQKDPTYICGSKKKN